MAFINRYVSFFGVFYSNKDAEMIGAGNAPEFTVTTYLNPFDITAMREELDNDGNCNRTCITTKGGSDIVADMTLGEFIDLINDFER